MDEAKLKAELKRYRRECEAMRRAAGQIYQAAGAYDMPEQVLDVLFDMAEGRPIRHKNILPVEPPASK